MKFSCSICGYGYEGTIPPEFCPQCKAERQVYRNQRRRRLVWADQHVIGVAKGVDERVVEGLQMNFMVVHRSRYVFGYEQTS